jgi:hypothetical protein
MLFITTKESKRFMIMETENENAELSVKQCIK